MTSTNSTQDRLSYLEKVASLVAAVASCADKNSGSTSNVSSSNNKRSEVTKIVQNTGKNDRNSSVNYSAAANPPIKSHGSERSDETSNRSFSPKKKTSVAKHQNIKSKNQDKMKRNALAISSESSYGTSSLPKTKTSTGELRKKHKFQVDESGEEDGEHDLTTQEGQMAMNPKLTSLEAGTEAKREYNRRNAARARKRNKHMVGDLQEKVHTLTKRTEDLQKFNDVLQAQLEVLQTQNRDLLLSRKEPEAKAQVQVQSSSSSSSNDIMSQLLEQLQGNSEAQQQMQTITQLLNNNINGQGSSSSQHRSSLQGGQQAEVNQLANGQGGGNAQLLSAFLGQSQVQQQLPRQEQSINSQTGIQGQSISQLLSTFGLQGLQQQQQQQQQQQRSHHQVSGATQDQQQNVQQLLSTMPPEALYNMLRESSRGEGRQ
jgi:hypothetical protein